MKAPLDPIITLLKERFARKDTTPTLQSLAEQTHAQWKDGTLQWGNMGAALEKAFDQVQWWQPNQSHQDLEKIDQQTLAWAKDAGFLNQAPIVRSRTKKNILGLKRIPAFYFPTLAAQKGEIMMASDEFGVLGLSKKDNVFFSNHPLEERFFVLFHEAAHSVFEDLSAPFQLPSSLYTKDFTADHAQLINGTYFALGFGNKAVTVFNEMFADTYGTIMLLYGCGFSQNAQDFIKQTIALRAAMQSEYEVERIVNGKRELKKFAPHNTATALRDVMNNIEQLKGKTPQELRNIACEIASVNWIKWLNPQRKIKTARGEKVEQGDLAINRLFSQNTVQNTIVQMGFQWMQNSNPHDLLQKVDSKLQAPLKKILKHMLESFEENITEPRKQLEINTLFNGMKQRMVTMMKMSGALKSLSENDEFEKSMKRLERHIETTNGQILPAIENLNADFMRRAKPASSQSSKKAKL